MDFYNDIAEYYDSIFPLSNAQLDFVRSMVSNTDTQPTRLLDIGCGTGSLSIALAEKGYKVTGIDSDPKMIKKATEKLALFPEGTIRGRVAPRKRTADPNNNPGADGKKLKPDFFVEDMLSIQNRFPKNHFDCIICFGNTLVHLRGTEEIEKVLDQAASLLKKEGLLLLQIINYDRIAQRFDHGLSIDLSDIENDVIRFRRTYLWEAESGKIDFTTVLTDKVTGREFRNSVLLYPLRKRELEQILETTGFGGYRFWGSFAKTPLTHDSVPMVVKAVKR